MIKGLIGRKIGMTQHFTEEGLALPATVIQAGPCLVLQRKTKEKDGYDAVQIGLLEDEVKEKRLTRSILGHLKKAKAPAIRKMKEFKLESPEEEIKVGQKVGVEIFNDEKRVHVVADSKGKGFSGVIKRWGFKGGKRTHGSMFHRAPGSIGASAYPSRVVKGKKIPGRMGGRLVTIKNLELIKIDTEKNLLIVKGAVPGSKGSYIYIKKPK
jgi:large subunit ribosomal protein L3